MGVEKESVAKNPPDKDRSKTQGAAGVAGYIASAANLFGWGTSYVQRLAAVGNADAAHDTPVADRSALGPAVGYSVRACGVQRILGPDSMAKPPIEWAGAGETGKVFQTDSHESYVDPGYGNETVEVSSEWTLAEFKSYELCTDAVLEVTRTIKMRTANNVSILIRSRGRTFFFADKLPNDVHAAVYAPAKSIKHDGVIQVIENDTVLGMRTMDHKRDFVSSLGDMLDSEPMLGFHVEPRERLRQAGYFLSGTLPGYLRNLELIDSLFPNIRYATLLAQEYIRQKLDYRTPDEELLRTGDFVLVSIRELLVYSWTGYEGSDIYYRLEELRDELQGLLDYARKVTPAEKDGWDHALDFAKAIGKAVVGLGRAVVELGAMVHDLTLKGADKIANLFGYEIEWKAWSAIGKAYEAGKTTKEIFTSVVNGIIDDWSAAFDKASNGDYSGLMDLGVELALDIGIEFISMGTATPAVAGKRVGTLARMATFTKEAAKLTLERAKTLLRKSKELLKKVPALAKRTLLDMMDSLEAMAYAYAHDVVDIGGGRLALRLDAIPEALARIRGGRAMEMAEHAVSKLRGAAKRAGTSLLGKLEKLATKMPHPVQSLAARIGKPGSGKLVEILEESLGTWVNRLDDDVAAAALRRTADAVDPVAYADNINWVMKRKGISANARNELVRQAVMRDKPLDLGWLRETDLDNKTLEFLATDPATNWTTFMKVSSKPSDFFPSSLRKQLKNSAYADAGAKLRGVAGELSFVVDAKNLPAGFRIEARQVAAGGKKIDFKLLDAADNPAMLEVKSWNAKRWTKELDANFGKPKLSGGTKSMIEQLQASKRAPVPQGKKMTVYLAVPDVITEADKLRLKDLLTAHGLSDVVIHEFPEAALIAVRNRLRDAMGLPAAGAAGVALVTADTDADYDDGRDDE